MRWLKSPETENYNMGLVKGGNYIHKGNASREISSFYCNGKSPVTPVKLYIKMFWCWEVIEHLLAWSGPIAPTTEVRMQLYSVALWKLATNWFKEDRAISPSG